MQRLRMITLITITLVSLSVTAAGATTLYVKPGGGGDALTIQAGIDLATDGDVVVVAAGTYTGPGNINLTYAGKNITVTSESGALVTVIDCASLGQAVTFTNGEGAGAVLEGFTIINGTGTHGGAIYCDGASPTIQFNVFCNNVAWSTGGAIHARNGNPGIVRNTFDGNGAATGGTIMFGPQSNVLFAQNIVCGTTSGGAFGCASAGGGTMLYCNDLIGNTGGEMVCAGTSWNNFSQDPLFCGAPGSGNFFLQRTSPCTAHYSPCGEQVGALGIQCDVTATRPATWGQVKSLYR